MAFTSETGRIARLRGLGLARSRFWRSLGFPNLVLAREAKARKRAERDASNARIDTHPADSEEIQRVMASSGHLVSLGWTRPETLERARETGPALALPVLPSGPGPKSEPPQAPALRCEAQPTPHTSQRGRVGKLTMLMVGANCRWYGPWWETGWGESLRSVDWVRGKQAREGRVKSMAVSGICDYCGEEVVQKYRRAGTQRLYHAGKCRALGEKAEHDFNDWVLMQLLGRAYQVIKTRGLNYNIEIRRESYPGGKNARAEWREFVKWAQRYLVSAQEASMEPVGGHTQGAERIVDLHTLQAAAGSMPQQPQMVRVESEGRCPLSAECTLEGPHTHPVIEQQAEEPSAPVKQNGRGVKRQRKSRKQAAVAEEAAPAVETSVDAVLAEEPDLGAEG